MQAGRLHTGGFAKAAARRQLWRTVLSVPITVDGQTSWAALAPAACRRPWESSAACTLLLTLWCLVLFFYGLGAGDLVRTEGLRAMVAREMLRSGTWIVPTLYGEPLFTKPPGMYIAIVLCSWPRGVVTPWSARLPSAIAAAVTVWMWMFSHSLAGISGRGWD